MFGINKLKREIKDSFYTSNFSKVIQKKSNELYIFGNGYSIANLDLNSFKSNDCFVCNEFYRFPSFNDFINNNNVTYFGMDGMSSFANLSSMMGYTLKQTLELLIDPWITNYKYAIIVPPSMLSYVKKKAITDKIGIISNDTQRILYKKTKGLNVAKELIVLAAKIRHTPQAMIFTGLVAGYSKIYLYGVDHTYVRDILNRSPMAGKHFYLESQEQVLNSNGISRRAQFDWKLSNLFLDNAATFQIYESQKKIADILNTTIQDRTGGSLFMFQDFDIFDLASLDTTSKQ